MSGSLRTDLYELTMATSYLRRAMDGRATFSLFVRALPPERGFLVANGVEGCLAWLEDLAFGPEDLAYLRGAGFDDEDLERLGRLRFTGDVWAVPEGTVVTGGEPLLEVTAPLPEAQVVETFLLNQITFQTALASKAARCVVAAGGRIELVEFGLRRTHGVEAGDAAARAAAMVGFASTSNVEAARRYGIRPAGTMAHSYVEAFPSELEAFRAYAQDHPRGVTLLVDTYDLLAGVRHAITVFRETGLDHGVAVRIDSGDLATVTRTVRGMLDEAGLGGVRIFVSGGLDEHDLAALVAAGAPVDAAGVGTRLGTSADAPFLDSAYKLVSVGDRPVMKLSPGKVTLPGAKQVFRGPGLADTIALRHEAPPPGTTPLLVEMMAGGRRLGPAPAPADALAGARERFRSDLAALPAQALALVAPQAPVPARSAALEELTRSAEAAARRAAGLS